MQHGHQRGRKGRKRNLKSPLGVVLETLTDHNDRKNILLGVSWNTVLDFPVPYLFFGRQHLQCRRVFDLTHYEKAVCAANVFQRTQLLH
jgi:hypothetical protein